jgi:hypothetical protein
MLPPSMRYLLRLDLNLIAVSLRSRSDHVPDREAVVSHLAALGIHPRDDDWWLAESTAFNGLAPGTVIAVRTQPDPA